MHVGVQHTLVRVPPLRLPVDRAGSSRSPPIRCPTSSSQQSSLGWQPRAAAGCSSQRRSAGAGEHRGEPLSKGWRVSQSVEMGTRSEVLYPYPCHSISLLLRTKAPLSGYPSMQVTRPSRRLTIAWLSFTPVQAVSKMPPVKQQHVGVQGEGLWVVG